MKIKRFSKNEAIRFGWNTMKNNFGFFVGLLMVSGLLQAAGGLLAAAAAAVNAAAGIIFQIADYALSIILAAGMIKISLKFCDDEKPRLADLFSQYRLLFNYFIGASLYALVFLGGLVFFIAPGVMLGIKFGFFGYLIVDKSSGPIVSLKKSFAATAGVKWDLFVFFLMIAGINLLGVLAFLIGVFAALPATMVASAFVYRELIGSHYAPEGREADDSAAVAPG